MPFLTCCVMAVSFRRHFIKLPCWTFAVAIAVLIFTGVYIHDFLRSLNVEYIPVVPLPDATLHEDVLGMDIQNILFYNRVPKTGSSSMMSMLRKLQRSNSFKYVIAQQYEPRHMNKTQQASVINTMFRATTTKYVIAPECLIYDQHVHFIDFTKHGYSSQPTYFNMVRDPFARFKSRFYWHRADHPHIPHQSERCFQDLHMIEPDSDPRGTNYWKWKNKTFEECVMDASDPECHINDGSFRDFYIPYFCGQDLECTKHNSRWALQRAMESVDRHYPVVGVLEELDKSLFVMQSLVPKFFRGISDLFGNGNAIHGNRQSYESKRSRDAGIEQIIKSQLQTEYEFYDFLKKRLLMQADKLLGQKERDLIS